MRAGARRARPATAGPRRGPRGASRPRSPSAARRRCTPSSSPTWPSASTPTTASGSRGRSSCSGSGEDPPERGGDALDRAAAPPDGARRHRRRSRRARQPDRRAGSTRWSAAGAAEEAATAAAAGASRTARSALGFDELIAGDLDAVKAAHRRYARRQMTWLRRMEGVEVVDRTGLERSRGGRGVLEPAAAYPPRPAHEVREVAGARQRLRDRRGGRSSLRADAGARRQRSARPHTGIGSDGVLLLSRPADPDAHVADLRIFNPDGSRGRALGQRRARGGSLPPPGGWTDRDEFAILTAAGEVRPGSAGPDQRCVAMGVATTVSRDYPAGSR